MDGILLQNIVFRVFALFLDLRGISSHKGSMGGLCIFQGQIGKITPQNPGKSGNFLVLTLFFHLSLSKIWLIRLHKNYIFEIIKDRAIISQSMPILT